MGVKVGFQVLGMHDQHEAIAITGGCHADCLISAAVFSLVYQ